MNFFKTWFKKRKPSGFRYKKIQFISSLADAPKDLGSTIFIVKNGGNEKWVVFKCPDNCGNRVEVNLMKSKNPHWSLQMRRKKISLSPSVAVKGCNSHFWLIDSQVDWAKH